MGKVTNFSDARIATERKKIERCTQCILDLIKDGRTVTQAEIASHLKSQGLDPTTVVPIVRALMDLDVVIFKENLDGRCMD